MAGFFSKKQYAAMAESELAIKLLKERCLECSIWAMFFNSSLTVSIKARFLSRILSATLIREFFMLFFTLAINVSIRPTTGIKPLYTTIATVTMNLIVSAAIVLLNPYVTVYISYKIPPFALSVHIPDVSTSIYVEVDSKVLLGLPFCDKAFVR